jgi:hypothetical protein
MLKIVILLGSLSAQAIVMLGSSLTIFGLVMTTAASATEASSQWPHNVPFEQCKFLLSDEALVAAVKGVIARKYPGGEVPKLTLVEKVEIIYEGFRDWNATVIPFFAGRPNLWLNQPRLYLTKILVLVQTIFLETSQNEIDAYVEEAVTHTRDWLRNLPLDDSI